MSGGWWIAVITFTFLAWSICLDLFWHLDAKLATWLLERTSGLGRWAAPAWLVGSLALALAQAASGWIAHDLAARHGSPLWALVWMLPSTFVAGPIFASLMPTKATGYASWRRSLESAGAERAVARGLAWAGGPAAFVGTVATIAQFFPVFYP